MGSGILGGSEATPMSSATKSPFNTSVGLVTEGSHAFAATLLSSVRAAAFWAAVLMPLVTILSVSSGVVVDPLPVVGLVGANAACAVVGHDYSP